MLSVEQSEDKPEDKRCVAAPVTLTHPIQLNLGSSPVLLAIKEVKQSNLVGTGKGHRVLTSIQQATRAPISVFICVNHSFSSAFCVLHFDFKNAHRIAGSPKHKWSSNAVPTDGTIIDSCSL